MKATRDLLIHNSGIVNKTYLDKAGKMARYTVGEQVVIDSSYFSDCWLLAKKLIDDIAAAAKHRLTKCGRKAPAFRRGDIRPPFLSPLAC